MKIVIGNAGPKGDGHQVKIDLVTLIPTRALIQANSGGGKSFLLRRLAEQIFGKVQTILIDPEGEFATLREKFDYVLVGQGGETPADIRSAGMLAEKLLELKASAVCDLYESFRSRPMDRRQWVRVFLNALLDAPRKLWHPLIVIVDEAHKFCPQETPKAASMVEREIISGCKEAMIALATTGRKRGFCPVWATQRLAKLDKDASAEMFNRLVGMTIEDVDVDRAADLMSVSKDQKNEFRQSLRTLQPGQFYAFGRAIAIERVLVKVGEVQTTHPESGSAKHSEPPPTPEAIRGLLPQLADLPKEVEEKARTMQDLQRQVRELQRALADSKKHAGSWRTGALTKEVKVADPRAIAAAVRKRDQDWQRVVVEFQRTTRGYLQDVAKTLTSKLGETLREATQVLSLPVFVPPAEPSGITQILATPAQSMLSTGSTPSTPSPPRPRPVIEGDGTVSGAQLRILSALAQFEAIGRRQMRKESVAVLAGASSTSSSYGNNLGTLRTAGYIHYPAPGDVALTDAGRSIAPQVEPPQDAEQMLTRCKQLVSGPQGRILDALRQAWPDQVDKEQLAAAAEASPTSSSYGNNLGFLRNAGMIEYPAKGTVKLAAWVMLEDQAA